MKSTPKGHVAGYLCDGVVEQLARAVDLNLRDVSVDDLTQQAASASQGHAQTTKRH
jgi:hypothetical protein